MHHKLPTTIVTLLTVSNFWYLSFSSVAKMHATCSRLPTMSCIHLVNNQPHFFRKPAPIFSSWSAFKEIHGLKSDFIQWSQSGMRICWWYWVGGCLLSSQMFVCIWTCKVHRPWMLFQKTMVITLHRLFWSSVQINKLSLIQGCPLMGWMTTRVCCWKESSIFSVEGKAESE